MKYDVRRGSPRRARTCSAARCGAAKTTLRSAQFSVRLRSRDPGSRPVPNDDVGTEVVEDPVDLLDPGGDRVDEDLRDRPLEGGQAGLVVAPLDVGVVDVQHGVHPVDAGAGAGDLGLVVGAAVPGDLVTFGDQLLRERQARAQVAGHRHGGEQDAGHVVLLGSMRVDAGRCGLLPRTVRGVP
jgi:hypothetical protein